MRELDGVHGLLCRSVIKALGVRRYIGERGKCDGAATRKRALPLGTPDFLLNVFDATADAVPASIAA